PPFLPPGGPAPPPPPPKTPPPPRPPPGGRRRPRPAPPPPTGETAGAHDTTRRFTFVITETALRWGFCPPEVRAGQAAHIASTTTLPNVEIGVIPLGAPVHEVPLHGYEMFDDRLVNVGLEHATVAVTDPSDIATCHGLFRLMADAASMGDDCRALLDQVRS
ncbi:Scr1 family TA system antitoxin-like transcriptional regulator, partial [Embleya sp. NPDC055610]